MVGQISSRVLSIFSRGATVMELSRRARIRFSSSLDYTVSARLAVTRYYDEVPRLALARGPSTSRPTVWFICPDYNPPSGGTRKLYHYVDVLNQAGLNASIMHTTPGFRLRWFNNNTRVVSAAEVAVGPRDLLVIGETYGERIRDLPRNVRHIIFNQNAHNTMRMLANGLEPAAPYIDNPDLALVLVVSEDNLEVMKYAFPEAPIRRVRPGIDPTLYFPPETPKQRRIAYMPRKRADDAAGVISLLKLRGVLDTWDVYSIDNCSEVETAEILRTAKLFLSFSWREGLGLPPLEALACGCLVVGYHGLAGREYFRPPFAVAVEDGDIAGFARSVEKAILFLNNDQDSSVIAAASRSALESFSPEVERRDLLDIFAPLLGR
jgi:glycosyltransferase involved in cell wall biosynthesis